MKTISPMVHGISICIYQILSRVPKIGDSLIKIKSDKKRFLDVQVHRSRCF